MKETKLTPSYLAQVERFVKDTLQTGCGFVEEASVLLEMVGEVRRLWQLEDEINRAPTLYGHVSKDGTDYHGWDLHQGEYETHSGKLVQVKRLEQMQVRDTGV